MYNYVVEKQAGGRWEKTGTTRDPDEWGRLMRSAYDPNGIPYRIVLGDKVLLETRLRDGGRDSNGA